MRPFKCHYLASNVALINSAWEGILQSEPSACVGGTHEGVLCTSGDARARPPACRSPFRNAASENFAWLQDPEMASKMVV